MDGFLEPALSKLLKDVNKKSTELRSSIANAIERVKEKSEAGPHADLSPADAYLEPLLMACKSDQPKLVVTALDCLQKLMSYGYLRGNRNAKEAGFEAANDSFTVMDVVVNTICSCEDTEGKTVAPDDAVQLQVIKALLTAVTCTTCNVHEMSLLNSVRACYHIHLYSRNTVNKTTAKATLTQMMNAVFQQMEVVDAKLEKKRQIKAQKQLLRKQPLQQDQDPALDQEREADSSETLESGQTHSIDNQADKGDLDFMDRKDKVEAMEEETEGSDMEKAMEKNEQQAENKPESSKTVLDENMYASVAEQLSLNFKSISAEEASVETSSSARESRAESAPKDGQFSHFRSMQHKDAYLIFRALCKLSMKNQNLIDGSGEENHVPDPVALRSKVLSLDLILNILENSGPAFRNSKDFIFAIRKYLSPSLIKNSLSSNTQVVGLSLRVFVSLQSKFARDLKAEIELVISKIYLPILESSNSPHDHKILVLEVLMQISKDVETLVSIFLSYDCDWESIDLYSRIVQVLSKIASETPLQASSNASQEETQKSALHAMSLKSMVSIVEALAEFTHLEDHLPANGTNPQEEASTPPGEGEGTSNSAEAQLKVNGGSAVISPRTAESERQEDPQVMGTESASVASAVKRVSSTQSRATASVAGDFQLGVGNLSGLSSTRKFKVDSFQQKQKYMRDVESAASKFNIKPKRGIDFLVAQGYIDNTPEDIASALLQFKDTFSKTMIGEFLGEDKDLNIQTLHSYVEQFSFKDRVIDEALRDFLSCFRLPGEAQKIDRMMERFAAQYVADNPNSFPSADVAFVLAFSVIMLQTDLHNPNIPQEKKMTKPGFLNNNRGIAGGRDLDPDFLCGIYDRIKANAISLKEDDGERAKLENKQAASTGGIFGNSKEAHSRRKRVAFSKEREQIVQHITSLLETKNKSASTKPFQLFKGKSGILDQGDSMGGVDGNGMMSDSQSVFNANEIRDEDVVLDGEYIFDSNDHVRPMFAVTWAPFCATFSVNLQNSDDYAIVSTVVRGMRSALRIACRFGMDDERKTLFDALIKFTLLNSNQEMKPKHIDCIHTLIDTVQQEGDFLGSSWEQALLCFSQLARMQLYTNGDALGSPSAAGSKRRPSSAASRRKPSQLTSAPSTSSLMSAAGDGSIFSYFQPQMSAEEIARITDEDNAGRLAKSLDMIQIDRIFLDSVNLGTAAIVDMVNALCVVSELELQVGKQHGNVVVGRSQLDTTPRTYSLQKIVEVADSNMETRPRFVWGRIWAVLSNHFGVAGCHQDTHISMYAVDSLRQLSVKFLEKDELAGFNFQLQFMQPFENMISHSNSPDQRDLVLRCLENIILSRSKHLRSGWRVMLNVIAAGGKDTVAEVSSLAFSILERIVRDHLEAVNTYFSELVGCLLSFAANLSIQLGLCERAMDLLETSFDNILGLSKSLHAPKIKADTSSSVGDIDLSSSSLLKVLTVVRAFCTLLGDRRVEIRSRASSTLFERLRKNFFRFSPKCWLLLYSRMVLTIFDSLKASIRPFTKSALDRLRSRHAELMKEVQATLTLDDDKDVASVDLSVSIQRDLLVESHAVAAGAGNVTTFYRVLKEVCELTKSLMLSKVEAVPTGCESKFQGWEANMKSSGCMDLIMNLTLETLEYCALLDSDICANTSIQLLSDLALNTLSSFEQSSWVVLCKAIAEILHDSTPFYLTSEQTRSWLQLDDGGEVNEGSAPAYDTDIEEEVASADDTDADTEESRWYPKATVGQALPFSTNTTFAMCSIHLQTLQMVGSIVLENLGLIPEASIILILSSLQNSMDFAHSFNDDLTLRLELQTRGFMQAPSKRESTGSVPTLLRQETLALGKYLSVLFRVDNEKSKTLLSAAEVEKMRKRLEEGLHMLFMHYLFQDRVVTSEREQEPEAGILRRMSSGPGGIEESDAEVDLRFFTPIVLLCLREVMEWDTKNVKKNLKWLYPLLTALLDCGNRDVHSALRQIFDGQISKLLGLDIPPK